MGITRSIVRSIVGSIVSSVAGAIASRVKDLFNAFNSDSTFSGPDTITADYLGVLQVGKSPYGQVEGGRYAETVADGAALGSEELVNGDASDTASTDSSVAPLAGFTNAGTHNAANKFTIESGMFRLISDGTYVGMSQTPLTIGENYDLFIYINDVAAGSLIVWDGVTTIATYSTSGLKTLSFTAASALVEVKRNSGPTDIKFYDWSIKPIIPLWQDTAADLVTSLQPFTVVNGIKQWIYHDPATINTAVAVGDFRSAIASDGTERYYTIAPGDDGTTGGVLPVFPTVGTVADGTATWTYGGWHSIEGYVNEEARTNYFLNSQVPVTQVITTTAQDYTVSVSGGAGSITLTGTATGVATEGNPLTVTATAGALTCTYAATLTQVDVQAGSFATSPIYTVASPVTRPATNLTRSTSTWPNLVGGVSNDFLITGRVEPEATAQGASKIFFDSFTDADNNLLFSTNNDTTVIFIKEIATATSFVSAAYTHQVGVGMEYQLYQVSTDGFGMGVALKVDGGSWSSWSVKHDADGRLDAPINSVYGIGSRGTAAHFNGYFPGVEIHNLTGIADPQAYAESLR